MVEIPDSLRSVFSANLRERGESYVIEVPPSEIEHEALSADETYRIAIFDAGPSNGSSHRDTSAPDGSQRIDDPEPPEPPVEEGDVRSVTVETVGDQGDGIAKVDRGYVVIVPGTKPGDQPTVEIEQVKESVAFASVVGPDSRAERPPSDGAPEM
jgi:predicted RNA-binding protein with TRAM domain